MVASRTPALNPNEPALEVHFLGQVEYAAATFVQERIADELLERDDRQGALLLCEHPPVLTIGREGSATDLLVERAELERRQTEIRWVNRAGGTWLMAPGQLVAYLIVPVTRLGWGPLDYRRRLEEALLGLSHELRIPAWAGKDPVGTCCRTGQFAFVGAAIRGGISQFGVCINVAPPIETLQFVRWVGEGNRVTSVAAQRARPIAMASVREGLMRHLAQALGYQRQHLYTGHRLLQRVERKVYVYS